MLTFKVQVDESRVVLHVISDLTLVTAVIFEGNVVDDDGGVTGTRLFQEDASFVGPKHTLLPIRMWMITDCSEQLNFCLDAFSVKNTSDMKGL